MATSKFKFLQRLISQNKFFPGKGRNLHESSVSDCSDSIVIVLLFDLTLPVLPVFVLHYNVFQRSYFEPCPQSPTSNLILGRFQFLQRWQRLCLYLGCCDDVAMRFVAEEWRVLRGGAISFREPFAGLVHPSVFKHCALDMSVSASDNLLAISPLQIFQYYLSSEIHIVESKLYLLSGGDDRA
ncbi:hypothetical protein V8G54_005071 [Vigna mungo]|uniref:Uncharacterized protein n=1 Tax=Vigna mungo TaxID=3915 RepID=A0AAQ3PJB0_VIGMU